MRPARAGSRPTPAGSERAIYLVGIGSHSEGSRTRPSGVINREDTTTVGRGSGTDGRGVHPGLRAALPFLPAVPVVAGLLLWAHFNGGYFSRVWYPSAIGAVLLLVGMILGTGRALPSSRPARMALLLLIGFLAWNVASMAWADSPGSALEAASKLTLVVAIAWALSLLPWSPRSATALLSVWALGVAAVCALSLVSALRADDLSEFFFKARYQDPLGYTNGVAALATMAFLPALLLSSRKAVPAALRILSLTAAAFLLQFALLPQSRAGLIALAAAVLVLLAVYRDRIRVLLALCVVAGAAAVSVGPAYHVYDVAIELSNVGLPPSAAVETALEDAVRAIVIGTLAAAAFGGLLVALDNRLSLSRRTLRRVRIAVPTALIAVLVIGAGAGLANVGGVYDAASDRWETFKSAEETPGAGGRHITASYSEQRFDYWRVALDAFREQPVTGLASGNYGRHYDAERRFSKPSRYAHDIWLRTLAEGGVVGALLFLGFLVVVFGSLLSILRRADDSVAWVIAAVTAVSIYFFVHASFDWLEEFPALAVPAFAFPLVALAMTASGPPPRSTRARRLATFAGISLAGIVVAVLAVQYLALRYYERGDAIGASNSAKAFEDLDRAADLNPLWVQPHLREGALAVRIDHPARARSAFREALDVEPNWYAYMELALLDAHEGRFASARRRLELASDLNASDEFLADARRLVRRGVRIDPAAFNRGIRERLRETLGASRADVTQPR